MDEEARPSGERVWVVILIAVVALGGVILWAKSAECTVGYTQTAMTMTIRGSGAQLACSKFQREALYETYRVTGQLTTPTLCEYDFGELRYIVRDEGLFVALGREMCEGLANQKRVGH